MRIGTTKIFFSFNSSYIPKIKIEELAFPYREEADHLELQRGRSCRVKILCLLPSWLPGSSSQPGLKLPPSSALDSSPISDQVSERLCPKLLVLSDENQRREDFVDKVIAGQRQGDDAAGTGRGFHQGWRSAQKARKNTVQKNMLSG